MAAQQWHMQPPMPPVPTSAHHGASACCSSAARAPHHRLQFRRREYQVGKHASNDDGSTPAWAAGRQQLSLLLPPLPGCWWGSAPRIHARS